MKRRAFVLAIASLLAVCLMGCGDSASADVESAEIYPKGIENYIDVEEIETLPKVIMKTTGEENGLGGTMYKIEGNVTKVYTDEESEAGLGYFVVKTSDGEIAVMDTTKTLVENGSVIGLTKESLAQYFIMPSVGEYVFAYAEYAGFSEVFKMPTCYYGGTKYIETISELSENNIVPKYELVETTTTKMQNGKTYVNYFIVVSEDVDRDGKNAIFYEMRNNEENYPVHTVYFYNDTETAKSDTENTKLYIDLIDDLSGTAPNYHYYVNPKLSSNQQSSTSDISTTTMGQRNAVAKAKEYLAYTAFSEKGLVEQLKYEGFSDDEATYGAKNSGADWNRQAAKKAQEYLDFSSFSRSGLIDQLIYEGFTQEQAEYGVSAVGY